MTPAMDSAGENQTPAALVHPAPGRDIEGKELRRNFQGSLRFASCSQLRDEESPESPKTDQNRGMSTRICTKLAHLDQWSAWHIPPFFSPASPALVMVRIESVAGWMSFDSGAHTPGDWGQSGPSGPNHSGSWQSLLFLATSCGCCGALEVPLEYGYMDEVWKKTC